MAPTLLRDFTQQPLPPAAGALLTLSLPQAVAVFAALLYYIDFLQSQSPQLYDVNHVEEYDFIVVGGGSAGCVLGNRLSTDYRVLLLEAAGDPNPLTYIPAFVISIQGRGATDWQFVTEPQKDSFLGMNEQRSRWPRGKGLGGSSNLNYMIYQRGHPRDFEQLAAATGDPSWRYEHLLPYFKKAEDYHGFYDNAPGAGHYHSQEGPLHVSKVATPHQLEEFLAGTREMGYEERDLNTEQGPGFTRMDTTIRKGLRWSAYAGYIYPIRDRDNLVISRYSRVVKIHVDKTRRAYGVSYMRHGVKKFARAKREVILSAGAIDSPKLLLLSGIGPCEELRGLGLPCRVDLPGVGKNLQDHVATLVGPFLLNAKSLLYDRDLTLDAARTYLSKGEGILASPLGLSAIGTIPSKLAVDPHWPDIFFFQVSIGVYKGLADDLTRVFGSREGLLQNHFAPYVGQDANFVVMFVSKPKSRGYLRLASANPWDKPVIQPNYFSHPDDLAVLVEGVRFTLNLYENTTVFQRLGAHLAPAPFPGCEHLAFKSDPYLECFVRHLPFTLYHPCGTCAMGKGEGDPEAVVDSQLRVRQVRGLRVVDASVLRHITNANLNAPTIAIAEKAADLIKGYWAQQQQVSSRPSYYLHQNEKTHSFYGAPSPRYRAVY